MQPFEMTATEAAAAMASGSMTAEALTRSLLARIAGREPTIKAWIAVDEGQAIRRARELDKIRVDRGALGPLHGLPFGVKDIIDTVDYPTTQNSPLYDGFQPAADAACIKTLKALGGFVLGKADTVEFAAGGRKALTRNPFRLDHTPGGSSSGSAGAVADQHVPLAFGTQTAGSLIRPASFTGTYCLKPTHGTVAWPGTMQSAPSLDTLGWFSRSAEDLTLVARAYRLRGMEAFRKTDIKGLKVGYCRTHNWQKADPCAVAAMDRAAARLKEAGAELFDLELDPLFASMNDIQLTIMLAEQQVHFFPEHLTHGAGLHPDFIAKAENAAGLKPAMIAAAYDHAARCRRLFDLLFGDRLDVILTPAAPGEAPHGLHSTGDYVMNAMWTLLHVPCIAMPVHKGPLGLPVGVQLVGPRFGDARLLSIAEAAAPVIDCGQ